MRGLEQVIAELRQLGYQPREVPAVAGAPGAFLAFAYQVPNGRFKGRCFDLGIGFQEQGYPEYPPHFIYVAGTESPGIHCHSAFTHGGVQWRAFSVPPNDFWDGLSSADKNMKTYMNRHLLRFWNQA